MERLLALVAALLLWAAPAISAPADAPLTERQIEATLAAMRELRPIMEKHRGELERLVPEEERAGIDPCAPPEKVRASAAYGEMEAVVRKHGFADAGEWCRVARRITAAYAAVKLDEEEPQWREKMAEVRRQIETAPNLSAEQKDKLLAQLEETTAAIGAQNAPEADKAAVKANIGEIEKALEELSPHQ